MDVLVSRVEYAYLNTDDGETTIQECGTCNTYCLWTFNETGSKTSAVEYLAYNRQVINACDSATYGMMLIYDGFGTIGNRFIVKADGATLYNSGCITVSGSTTITVPMNTSTFEVLVYGSCLTYGTDIWSFSGSCL